MKVIIFTSQYLVDKLKLLKSHLYKKKKKEKKKEKGKEKKQK